MATKKKIGKIPLVDSSPHLDVTVPGALVMSDADLPFQPFSAALRNLQDKESLLSPAALASGDPTMMTPLQQARAPPSECIAVLRGLYFCYTVVDCGGLRSSRCLLNACSHMLGCRRPTAPLAGCEHMQRPRHVPSTRRDGRAWHRFR